MSKIPGNPVHPHVLVCLTRCRVACTASSLALALVDSAARQCPSQASGLPPQRIACPPQGTFITGNQDSLLCVLGQNCHLYHWQEKRSGQEEVIRGIAIPPLGLGR